MKEQEKEYNEELESLIMKSLLIPENEIEIILAKPEMKEQAKPQNFYYYAKFHEELISVNDVRSMIPLRNWGVY